MGLSYEVRFNGTGISVEIHNVTDIIIDNGVYRLYSEDDTIFLASVEEVLFILSK